MYRFTFQIYEDNGDSYEYKRNVVLLANNKKEAIDKLEKLHGEETDYTLQIIEEI